MGRHVYNHALAVLLHPLYIKLDKLLLNVVSFCELFVEAHNHKFMFVKLFTNKLGINLDILTDIFRNMMSLHSLCKHVKCNWCDHRYTIQKLQEKGSWPAWIFMWFIMWLMDMNPSPHIRLCESYCAQLSGTSGKALSTVRAGMQIAVHVLLPMDPQ